MTTATRANKAPRQAWLDYIKFIAMLLVVVYHTPPRFAVAHEVALFNLGAPVFFFAAGYLFNIAKFNGFLAFVRHRARQILVPYVTFFVVFYALWLAVGRTMAGPEEQAIGIYTPLVELLTGCPRTVLGPFWFLACLFTMQLIYYPLRRWLPGALPLLVSILLSVSLLIMPDWKWLQYWNLDHALLYMPLYAVGNCCKTWFGTRVSFDSLRSSLLWLALAVVGLAFLILAPLYLDAGVAYVCTPEAVILTLPAITASAKWLESRFGTSRVAQNVAITSITYLAVQNYVIGVVKIVVARVVGAQLLSPDSLATAIVIKVAIALAVMAVIYPIALLVERYCPWMLGKWHKQAHTLKH